MPSTLDAATLATALALPLALASTAHAERPVLAGEATHGAPGGHVLIHYATTGTDAVPAADADGDGAPDFVEQVAEVAEDAFVRFLAMGFRAPLSDGALGGDARTDIYLRNLVSADGNAGTDSCTGDRCIGFVVAENDYAGFGYPTVLEGIRSVVPHEIFHLVQKAYFNSTSVSWDEGTAVWAVEELYGAENSDFERFLPSFLTRSYRPFERPVAGFGDSYPYGAALWPYFLSHRFDAQAVVAAWEACETEGFLDAANTALAPLGASLDAAFVEFTRWNLFTGDRATGGSYPEAAAWAQVPREAAISGAGRIFIEGLSARYTPVVIGDHPRIAVTPSNGVRIAAWLVRDGGALADGIELEERDGVHAATVPAGSYTLVVTGLTRNTIATAIDVALTPPVDEPPAGDDDDGGCRVHRTGTSGTGSACMTTAMLIAAALLGGRRKPRASLRYISGRAT